MCEKFTPWHQGFTPKEHKESLDEIDHQKRQAEEAEKNRRHQRLTLAVSIGGLAVAVITTIVSTILSKSPPVVNVTIPFAPVPAQSSQK